MQKLLTLGVAAATLTTAMVGVPAMPNTPLGVGEAHADSYYRRHRRHRDNFDFGDAVIGAIVAGGLIAVLSGASKKKDEDRPVDPAWEPQGDWDRDRDRSRDGDWSWQDRDWSNRTNEERAAISICAREAEDLGSRYGRDARVRGIDGVDRQGGEYRVRGIVDVREDDDRRAEGRDPRDADAFTCYVRNDRITDFRFSEAYAGR